MVRRLLFGATCLLLACRDECSRISICSFVNTGGGNHQDYGHIDGWDIDCCVNRPFLYFTDGRYSGDPYWPRL